MKHVFTVVALGSVLVMVLVGCKKDDSWTSWSAHPESCPCDGGSSCEEEGEHEDGEHEEEGEESGTQYAKDETLDDTFNGARLIMSYDDGTNLFTGTVENVTEDPLCYVRVEVHLSNGVELGPTDEVDLDPGTIIDVELDADEGHEGEGEGEHE
jgi:hypothetical protein